MILLRFGSLLSRGVCDGLEGVLKIVGEIDERHDHVVDLDELHVVRPLRKQEVVISIAIPTRLPATRRRVHMNVKQAERVGVIGVRTASHGRRHDFHGAVWRCHP